MARAPGEPPRPLPGRYQVRSAFDVPDPRRAVPLTFSPGEVVELSAARFVCMLTRADGSVVKVRRWTAVLSLERVGDGGRSGGTPG